MASSEIGTHLSPGKKPSQFYRKRTFSKHLSFGLYSWTMFWTATFIALSFWPLLTTPPSRPGLITSSMPDGFAISSGPSRGVPRGSSRSALPTPWSPIYHKCKKLTSLKPIVRTMRWYHSTKTAKIFWVTPDGATHGASINCPMHSYI